MSLFQRPIQPPAILSDQAVERYLEAVRAELSVDPLFRRRLRGSIVNRFVAEREGRAPAAPRRRMGALGRAVLYASFALSVSVSSAMAASQGAAPGDALYPLKIQIERLRLQALPESLHDDLALHALGERVHELGVLAERGDWARVARQGAAVETEYRHFLATTRTEQSSDRYLVVLSALLERLPDRAQDAIETVLMAVEAASERTAPPPPRPGSDAASVRDGRGPDVRIGHPPTATEPATPEPAVVEPIPKPTPPERLDPTPRTSSGPRSAFEPPAPSETEAPADEDATDPGLVETDDTLDSDDD